MEKGGEEKILKCRLQFKIVFEEVWDFFLKFQDWRTTDLEKCSTSSINPQLEIKLPSKQAIGGTLTSVQQNN